MNEEYGPAMRALKSDVVRTFVAAYVENGGNATQACRKAGYKAERMTGWRLLQRSDVQAAISELCEAGLKGLTPSALHHLEELLNDPNHRDHGKAVFAVLDRTGLHAVSEQRKTLHIEDKHLDSAIKSLAAELGFDYKHMIPRKTAKMIDVTPRDGSEGIEDLL